MRKEKEKKYRLNLELGTAVRTSLDELQKKAGQLL